MEGRGSPDGGAAPPIDGAFDRERALERLGSEHFDVLVVGGGATGAGVALDAASRGLSTALVDKGDFASGTSSKSSKMIHGGLRYLQQREIRLVYENLAERHRLLHNAPHLVSPLPFLIPLFGRNGVLSKTVARSYSSALWLYDLTGGLRIGSRHRRIGREEALRHLPELRVDHLVAGFVYLDARADDARLTLEVLRTAALDHGAAVANHAAVDELLREGGRVVGARVRPDPAAARATAQEAIDVRARVVVNATGVWADQVAGMEGATSAPALRPAKGVHVTVPATRLHADIAAVIPVAADRRSIFVVPWPEADLVYLGTTDTGYEGPTDDPSCSPEDVDYLLEAVNAVTTADLGRRDVTGVWAGLRPLLAPPGGRRISERTADLSRRHAVTASAGGVVTVTGGKLTTYRKMAEDTVDRVVEELGGSHRRSVTAHLRLRGAGRRREGPPTQPSLPDAVRTHLWSRYGTESSAVMALGAERPELLEPVVAGLPYLGAEVVYAARHEMARSIDDVLARRTRARIQRAAETAAAAPTVARLLAPELGWSEARAHDEATRFTTETLGDLERAGVAHRAPSSLGAPPSR